VPPTIDRKPFFLNVTVCFIHRYQKTKNRLLKFCYVPATSAVRNRLLFFLFLLWPFTVLMKQTRQAVCTIKQSIFFRCLWFYPNDSIPEKPLFSNSSKFLKEKKITFFAPIFLFFFFFPSLKVAFGTREHVQ
jgi:hypothetical protein